MAFFRFGMDWRSAKKFVSRNIFLAGARNIFRQAFRLFQRVRFGSLRRLSPVSRVFGYDRGPKSVTRYYIDVFLGLHAEDIQGDTLEIGDDTYTRLLGGKRVKRSEVLHAVEGNPRATIVSDLTRGDNLSSESYDCIVMPQTLQFIYDLRLALDTSARILRPGGTLLATLSGISQISRYDMDRWGEYWRFTELSARRLFAECFAEECITVQGFGNVLSAVSLLHGLASCELRPEELDFRDPDYPVVIGVRAVKAHVPP
jgi:hypothetical protein